MSTVLIPCSKVAFCPSTVSTQAKSSAQNEHGAARFRSCYFTIFCVNILTKSDKRFIISLQMNIGIFRNTARAGFARSTEKRGVKPRRRNGTVRCMFFPTARRRGHSRERGRLCGKNGRKPTHQVRIFGSNLHSWLSQRSSMQCIKTFAPRFEKTLVLFYCRNRRERTLPFFTV